MPRRNEWKVNFLQDYLQREIRYRPEFIQINQLCWVNKPKNLTVGENVEIKKNVIIDASGGVCIGDNCQIGKNLSSINKNLELSPIIIGNGNIISQQVENGFLPNKEDFIKHKGKGFYFVLGTGRSGSNAIVQLLNQHSQVSAYHDTFPILHPVIKNCMEGEVSRHECKDKIATIFNMFQNLSQGIHVFSDHKLSGVISILNEIFPEAKFIWMIRNAEDFVNSSYPRGWFSNEEYGFTENKNEEIQLQKTSNFNARNRLDGSKIGAFTNIEWREMTGFERNCWYWQYWNNLIKSELEKLSPDQRIKIKLDQLKNSPSLIVSFLGVNDEKIKSEITNRASYKKLTRDRWTNEMDTVFDKWCKPKMKELYED